jgi:FkbM family methyltransferase
MSIFHWDDYERVEYPLDENSVVFDVGGFVGNWSQQIWDKYHCNIHIFEPVAEYSTMITEKFKGNGKIKVHPVGLSDKCERLKMNVAGDRSSVHDIGTNIIKTEDILLVDAVEWIKNMEIDKIDLMKINIEGGEYALLRHLTDMGFIRNITDIQIQFHIFNREDFLILQEKARSELFKTHHMTYQFVPHWENWRMNNA